MKKFWQRTDTPTRKVKQEIAAATNHIDELTAQLAAIEQKASEALVSARALEDRRQGLQNELAQAQRCRADAEMRLAAIEQKLSEAVLSIKTLEDQRQSLQNELAEEQGRQADAETRLAAIEQKLSEVSVKAVEDQRQDVQNKLDEEQRRRADAELRLAALLQAAERAKGSNGLENVTRSVKQTNLSIATGTAILIFAFIVSFLVNAAVFGLIPWR